MAVQYSSQRVPRTLEKEGERVKRLTTLKYKGGGVPYTTTCRTLHCYSRLVTVHVSIQFPPLPSVPINSGCVPQCFLCMSCTTPPQKTRVLALRMSLEQVQVCVSGLGPALMCATGCCNSVPTTIHPSSSQVRCYCIRS